MTKKKYSDSGGHVKSKIILISITALALTNVSFASNAQYGDASSSAQYGAQSSANYGSSAHYGNPTTPAAHYEDDTRPAVPRVTISSSAGNFVFGENGPRFEPKRRHKRLRLAWVDMFEGQALPSTAVIGGSENYRPLFVCHANYANGIHPGKVVAGKCNITWGGHEIAMPEFQVLTSERPLNWIPASNGFIPPNAISGGFEPGRTLFVCQARYNGGIHPGKIVGRACNFGWGGREVSTPYYNVLVP